MRVESADQITVAVVRTYRVRGPWGRVAALTAVLDSILALKLQNVAPVVASAERRGLRSWFVMVGFARIKRLGGFQFGPAAQLTEATSWS